MKHSITGYSQLLQVYACELWWPNRLHGGLIGGSFPYLQEMMPCYISNRLIYNDAVYRGQAHTYILEHVTEWHWTQVQNGLRIILNSHCWSCVYVLGKLLISYFLYQQWWISTGTCSKRIVTVTQAALILVWCVLYILPREMILLIWCACILSQRR